MNHQCTLEDKLLSGFSERFFVSPPGKLLSAWLLFEIKTSAGLVLAVSSF
jgi:hypothetical protein